MGDGMNNLGLPRLTNYADHPTAPDWVVFRFAEARIAEEFCQELQAKGMRHERDQEDGPPYLVAVRRIHRSQAVRLNYAVLGRHRKPFIANRALRWSVLALMAALLALSVAGRLMSR
ncbi:MAG: hypothetical protein ACK4L7_04365 [Flavobacteriales bacterium]